RREFPHGQASALVVLREKCVDEVARAPSFNDRVERVRGAESVPEGEDRVDVEAARRVNLHVAPAVAAVNVREEVGREHQVIQSRVEGLQLRLAPAPDLNLTQLPLPRTRGVGTDARELL